MSYASPPLVSEGKKNTSAENVVSRVGATSWKNIFHAVAVLLDECLVQQKTGGAVIVPNALLPKRPILTIFAYEVDSYFETILNDYQNHPHGVRPIDPKILSGNESVIALNDIGSNADNVSTA
ncbi:MAG: hypothetical protein L6R37_005660 [Teloschistes peruensis]|nr:MAG: hypothetical protein L6R37_005660 [Teloschistes peruensis]